MPSKRDGATKYVEEYKVLAEEGRIETLTQFEVSL